MRSALPASRSPNGVSTWPCLRLAFWTFQGCRSAVFTGSTAAHSASNTSRPGTPTSCCHFMSLHAAMQHNQYAEFWLHDNVQESCSACFLLKGLQECMLKSEIAVDRRRVQYYIPQQESLAAPHHRTPMTRKHHQLDLYVTRTNCVASLRLYRMMMQSMAHALMPSTTSVPCTLCNESSIES